VTQKLPSGPVDRDGPHPQIKRNLIIIAALFIVALVLVPIPKSMVDLVREERPSGYQVQPGTNSITESVNKILQTELTPEQVASKTKIMIAILLTAAFLWGTEAIPLGATDLLVGSFLYLFAILPLDSIARAYMKDAVFFIFGVLTIAVGVSKTGLDRRIGVVFLSRIKNLKAFCFVFLPGLALTASFLSEHALVAILVPVLMRMYRMVCDSYKIESDRHLAMLLVLGICFACNQGGPGSPASGGRNAIMVGYLADFGQPISFIQWMKYSVPFVVVVSQFVGAYMYFTFRRKIKVPDVNFAELMKNEVKNLGKMSPRESVMALTLAGVVVCWIFANKKYGMGGPCIFAVVVMLVTKVITWQDVQTRVRFDVVGLYGAACAIGVGLKITGGSVWLARTILSSLPGCLRHGDSLLIASSVFTGTLTNLMSDGATVAAIGPVALSLGEIANLPLWKIGLGCAFASSFANATIVGTPNNAIAYVGAVDPKSGEKLLHLKDFLRYGIAVTGIAWLVLWFWAFLGYWKWLAWG